MFFDISKVLFKNSFGNISAFGIRTITETRYINILGKERVAIRNTNPTPSLATTCKIIF